MSTVGATLRDDALALHREAIVINGLDVSRLADLHDAERLSLEQISSIKTGGIHAMNYTIGGIEGAVRATKAIAKWLLRIEKNQDKLQQVTRATDIYEAKEAGKVGLIFGFQGGNPIEDDLAWFRIYHKLGLRISGLTYSYRNLLGDGCYERVDAGLSEFGLQAVAELNKLGILIDLSHAGIRTSMDAMEHSKDPVVFSHSNARSLCDHPRNLADEQLKALSEKDGVVGICAAAEFTKRSEGGVTIQDLMKHVNYIAQLIGARHLGIGLDLTQGRPPEDYLYDTGDIVQPTNLRKLVIEAVKQRSTWTWKLVEGLSSFDELPRLTQALLEGGFSKTEIKGILGENFLRVFHRVWR